MEVLTIGNAVKLDEREEYIRFVNENHEQWIEEAHLATYGNLDRLTPEKYNPFIKKKGPEGHVPDDSTEDTFILNSYSPPPLYVLAVTLLVWLAITFPDDGRRWEAGFVVHSHTFFPLLLLVSPHSNYDILSKFVALTNSISSSRVECCSIRFEALFLHPLPLCFRV